MGQAHPTHQPCHTQDNCAHLASGGFWSSPGPVIPVAVDEPDFSYIPSLCHFWSSEESHHSEPSKGDVISLVPSLQLRLVVCFLGLPVEYLHLIGCWPYGACAPQNILSGPVHPSSDPCHSVSGISHLAWAITLSLFLGAIVVASLHISWDSCWF